MVSDYRVVVYNVFIERGNVAVLTCHVPAPVQDHVEVLGWWRYTGMSISDLDNSNSFVPFSKSPNTYLDKCQ